MKNFKKLIVSLNDNTDSDHPISEDTDGDSDSDSEISTLEPLEVKDHVEQL